MKEKDERQKNLSLSSPQSGEILRKDGEFFDKPDYHGNRLLTPEGGYGFSLIRAYIKPGGESPPKRMITAIRVYFVISGSGEFVINEESYKAEKDKTFLISPGGVYSFKAGEGGMEIFEVNVPGADSESYEFVEPQPQ